MLKESSIFAVKYCACLVLGHPDPIYIARFNSLWSDGFLEDLLSSAVTGLALGPYVKWDDVFGLLDKLGDVTVSSGLNLLLS